MRLKNHHIIIIFINEEKCQILFFFFPLLRLNYMCNGGFRQNCVSSNRS